ncbi:MAG: FHA domain-containing protein [Anaerolineae bacterium]
MNEAAILLALRLGAAALLLLFTGSILLLLWRDYRITTREIEQQRIPRGKLIVLASDAEEVAVDTEFPLLPHTSLGRAPTNTVYLADSFASNEHAQITYRGGNWWLEDRGSSNGTFLNGTRINEPVILSSGDLIGIGRVTLRLQLE